MSYVRDALPDFSAGNLDVALRCAAAGLPTFPCNHDKTPANGGAGYKDATTLDYVVKLLWQKNPGALAAINCEASRLIVIDADAKTSKPDGVKNWEALIEGREADVAAAPVVITPSGGLHIYFKLPQGMAPTNSPGNLPLDIDVRSKGYVVAPSTMTTSGEGWFTAPNRLSPVEAFELNLIPELPQWLRELIEAPKVRAQEKKQERAASSGALRANSPERESAYGRAALDGIAADLAAVTSGRNAALNTAALKAGRHCAAGRISEGEAYDALHAACIANSWIAKDGERAFDATFDSGFNAGLKNPAEPLEDCAPIEEEAWLDFDAAGNIINIETGLIVKAAANRNSKLEQKPRPTLVKPLAQFVSEYEPISYTLAGILPSGSLYFLTARSGTGKTAFNVLFVLAVASGRSDLLGIEVERGRVAYLVFENPDDVRAKLMVAMFDLGVDERAADKIVIVDRHAKIDEIFRDLKIDADAHGPFQAVVVDTFQASFDGDDFNANGEVLRHSQRLRTFTQLPGKPSVIVSAHPVKNATEDNLLPYGGGSIVNEVDGNLTLWFKDNSIKLDWTKVRGPQFNPRFFGIQLAVAPAVVDKDGGMIQLPVMRPIAEHEAEKQKEAEIEIGPALLRAIYATPAGKQEDWAAAVGCSKSTVNRTLQKLKDERLVKSITGKWRLTPAGEKEAKIPFRDAEPATNSVPQIPPE